MREKFTLEEFIERANKIHVNKYDYSKTEYVNVKTKICVICPIHGEFFITPNHHLHGVGCPKCAGRYKTTEDIVKEFKEIHGDKYDYSKVKYVNATTKVCIICPKHGEFWQRPSDHLSGYGCPHCKGKAKRTTKWFIEKAKETHGNKYDYSMVEYKGCRTPIKILCPIHGEFWQVPYKHLQGRGCPYCNESHLEKEVRNALDRNKIRYVYQCNKSNLNWLKLQSLDFYLPEYKIAIECQGLQHYAPIEYFGGEEKFSYTKELDRKKKKLCKENGIKLLYFTKCKNNSMEITDTNKLIEKIICNNG